MPNFLLCGNQVSGLQAVFGLPCLLLHFFQWMLEHVLPAKHILSTCLPFLCHIQGDKSVFADVTIWFVVFLEILGNRWVSLTQCLVFFFCSLRKPPPLSVFLHNIYLLSGTPWIPLRKVCWTLDCLQCSLGNSCWMFEHEACSTAYISNHPLQVLCLARHFLPHNFFSGVHRWREFWTKFWLSWCGFGLSISVQWSSPGLHELNSPTNFVSCVVWRTSG